MHKVRSTARWQLQFRVFGSSEGCNKSQVNIGQALLGSQLQVCLEMTTFGLEIIDLDGVPRNTDVPVCKNMARWALSLELFLVLFLELFLPLSWALSLVLSATIFTESASRPIQPTSRDVRLCVVCCPLRQQPEPRELETSDQRVYC